jgi:hypothetical protein
MTQIIQELVSQAFPLVCPGDKPRDIQKFNWHGTFPVVAATVIGLALVCQVISFAGAVYLEITDGSLRIDCGESISRSDY